MELLLPPPQPESTRDIELKQQTRAQYLNLDIAAHAFLGVLGAVSMVIAESGLLAQCEESGDKAFSRRGFRPTNMPGFGHQGQRRAHLDSHAPGAERGNLHAADAQSAGADEDRIHDLRPFFAAS